MREQATAGPGRAQTNFQHGLRWAVARRPFVAIASRDCVWAFVSLVAFNESVINYVAVDESDQRQANTDCEGVLYLAYARSTWVTYVLEVGRLAEWSLRLK